MHLVAVVASFRRKGNSELLAKLALQEALKNGASGEVVYLKDFSISECTGCMKCVFKGVKCPLEDDVYRFFAKVKSADGLLLTAPTYVLSPPGLLKMVVDRYLLMREYFEEIYSRPAVSIGTGGLPNWGQFQLPMMNIFLLSMGFRIVDSFIAYGAGPGESLLNNKTISRLKSSLRNILKFQNKPFQSQISKHCPVCFSTLFERIEGKRYRCPICFIEAEEREDGFYFSEDNLNNHRWTKEKVKDHFENWILKTEVIFRKKLREIHKRKTELVAHRVV